MVIAFRPPLASLFALGVTLAACTPAPGVSQDITYGYLGPDEPSGSGAVQIVAQQTNGSSCGTTNVYFIKAGEEDSAQLRAQPNGHIWLNAVDGTYRGANFDIGTYTQGQSSALTVTLAPGYSVSAAGAVPLFSTTAYCTVDFHLPDAAPTVSPSASATPFGGG
ncbi:MAG TPA: hypothetical protein V6D47_04990 [Oscillatoriaceae cyanobacterium]